MEFDQQGHHSCSPRISSMRVDVMSEFIANSSAPSHGRNIGSRIIGLSVFERFIKRTFDLIGAALIALLFGPIFLCVAICIALSSGPRVMYSQMRVGRNGQEFRIFKFRSMVQNSGEVLQELLDSDPQAREEWARDFKLKDDPRITRIGRFIRKTSLDELPQLWNVLRGDMSLVGPRPVVQAELDTHYGASTAHYCSVKPGLTGLWQVSGRNDVSYEQRVAMDRHYVESWSPVTDFLIVLRTAGVMFGRNGAY